MRHDWIPFGLALALAGALSACNSPAARETGESANSAPALQLASAAFGPGGTIPDQFTCAGVNMSPPLVWSDPPPGTRSFALVVEDPDAPGGTFHHWGVYNLPSDLRRLAGGDGDPHQHGTVQTKNDFGDDGYGGPCPPPGDKPHRYAFRVLALDLAKLPGTPARAADIARAIDGHVLASADLIGLYGR